MGAPKGNKFWERRTKHGRDKIFETPDILWDAAVEYFNDTLSNPLNEVDFVGKDAKEVSKPHTPPLTIQGLCIYLGVNTVYFNHFETNVKSKKDSLSKDFTKICTHIRDVIYKQKFDGASTGFYNANIIARDLGLTDKKDLTTAGDPMSISVNVQDKSLAEKLKKE
jgi:hypothetical protein